MLTSRVTSLGSFKVLKGIILKKVEFSVWKSLGELEVLRGSLALRPTKTPDYILAYFNHLRLPKARHCAQCYRRNKDK